MTGDNYCTIIMMYTLETIECIIATEEYIVNNFVGNNGNIARFDSENTFVREFVVGGVNYETRLAGEGGGHMATC